MNLPKTAKLIPNSQENWIDIDGSVYAIDGREGFNRKLIKKSQHIVHGYKYCGINYKTGQKSKRVHRLVAEAFIPNPNNLPIVGHKNNIKSDNRVENLYWTTISENTQKAFNDGLAKNAKGGDDSQSIPVKMFSTLTNELLGEYGSMREAARETGIELTLISRQARYKRPTRREFYFRFSDDPSALVEDQLVGKFRFDDDTLVETFFNTGEASRKTGISERTISNQCQKDRKPKNRFSDFYFLRIKNDNK